LTIATLIAIGVAFTACQKEKDVGPLEKLGRRADENIEKVGKKANKVGKKLNEAGKDIKRGAKKVKEKIADGADKVSEKLRENSKEKSPPDQ